MSERQEQTKPLAETNRQAVNTVITAVQGTIGPKGLDTMLIDRFEKVFITNDGYTILDRMDVHHPVAKLLVGAVRAQEDEVGDGTTTTALLAGHMVLEGYDAIQSGVPVSQVLAGIKKGQEVAQDYFKNHALEKSERQWLYNVSTIAARENEDIAHLVMEAYDLIGEEGLKNNQFRLQDMVTALEGAEGEVFQGLLIKKEPLFYDMPKVIKKANILTLDDAFVPPEAEPNLLTTPEGFRQYSTDVAAFRALIQRIQDAGVNVVFIQRALDAKAEADFAQAGILAVPRMRRRDLEKIADHTNSRLIKQTQLEQATDLSSYIGHAEEVVWQDNIGCMRIEKGSGKAYATIVVGAATAEVVDERARIACDAAASLQAAINDGFVPGGGAAEVAAAHAVEQAKLQANDMTTHGMEVVAKALRKPFLQMTTNAGFHGLEKLELVEQAQKEKNDFQGMDFNTGQLVDLEQAGILDPLKVKQSALKIATEVAMGILRIRVIIRARDEIEQDL